MLDRLMVRRNVGRDVFTDGYRPEQAVTNHKLVNSTGQNLCVIFPPWHGGGPLYEVLIHRLARKGNAVLAYYLHDEILKPDVEQVAASFIHIRDTVAEKLNTLAASGDYSTIKLKAMSIGNPALAITTSRFTAFGSTALVTPSRSLAESMWFGSRTQHIQTAIEQQGYTLADVEEAWADMAPINHLGALVGKDVFVLLSQADNVIPTSHQENYLQAMLAAGVDPVVQTSSFGHYATIGRYCLEGKV